MSSSPDLCSAPPPSLTAFFSYLRNPGVVFLVPQTFMSGSFSLRASTASEVAVAMPLILIMKLSAVRSAVRSPLTGPLTEMTLVPAFTREPSLTKAVASAPTIENMSHASSSPATTASCSHTIDALPLTSGNRSAVASPLPTSSFKKLSRPVIFTLPVRNSVPVRAVLRYSPAGPEGKAP